MMVASLSEKMRRLPVSVTLRYSFGEVRGRGPPVAILLLVAMPAMALISTGLEWLLLGVPLSTAALSVQQSLPRIPSWRQVS